MGCDTNKSCVQVINITLNGTNRDNSCLKGSNGISLTVVFPAVIRVISLNIEEQKELVGGKLSFNTRSL